MTASTTNYWTFTLNVVNLVSKAKYSKIYSDTNITSSEIGMKVLDSTAVAVYLADKFLVVNIGDLSVRQSIVFSEITRQNNLRNY